MTVSSTHFWVGNPPEAMPAPGWRARLQAAWVLARRRACWTLLLCLGLWLSLPGPAAAQAGNGEITDLKLEAADTGLYLSAALHFELPDLAEDALLKGITLYFVEEAEVLRERWYWSDKTVARATRYLRLSYQPLTRRWRLNQSTMPFQASGLGVALGQSYDELEEALMAMQRISRWRIADIDDIDRQAAHLVHLRFRLDMSQLPRPFQIGAMGRSGWDLAISRTERLAIEPQP